MKKLIVLLSSTMLLNGCAVMSKNECMTANWNLIGQQDGFKGNGSLLQQRTQACVKHQIILDNGSYTSGYNKGLKNYCNPQTVFDYALQGNGNYQSCPMEMQNRLRPYYTVANNFYKADKQLKSLEDDIASYRVKAYDDDLKEDARKDYRKRLIEARYKLNQVERDYANAQYELMQFKYQMRF